MEKGVPLPEFPDLHGQESRIEVRFEKTNPRWPLGLGAICIMMGFGVMGAFLLSHDHDLWNLWSMGLLGIFFGAGLVLYYYLTRTPEQK